MTFAEVKSKIRDLQNEPCSPVEAGILDILIEIVDCLEQGSAEYEAGPVSGGNIDEPSEPPYGFPGS